MSDTSNFGWGKVYLQIHKGNWAVKKSKTCFHEYVSWMVLAKSSPWPCNAVWIGGKHSLVHPNKEKSLVLSLPTHNAVLLSDDPLSIISRYKVMVMLQHLQWGHFTHTRNATGNFHWTPWEGDWALRWETCYHPRNDVFLCKNKLSTLIIVPSLRVTVCVVFQLSLKLMLLMAREDADLLLTILSEWRVKEQSLRWIQVTRL